MANNLFLKTSINGAENVKNSLRGMRNTMKDVTSNTKKMAQTNKSLGQSFRNLNKDVNRNGVAMGNLSKIYRGFSVAKTIGQIYLIGRVLAGAIESTMDMIETQNLFNNALSDFSVETGKYLANLSSITGLDLTNLKNSVATFSLLGRSMGFSSEQASILGINANNLAQDMASLVNVPIAQAMGDLRSGLLGQSETVYKYGFDVTEAAIKQEALNMGIKKSVRNMSQGEKMALRWAVIVKQSSIYHGDFARTLNDPANQMRILKERMVTLSRTIGSIFLPTLQVVLPYLNAFAILLTRVASAIAKFVGFEGEVDENLGNSVGNSVEDSMDDASGAIGGATKKLKEMRKYLLGIDELNVIPEETDTSAGGGGAGDLTGSILDQIDIATYDAMLEQIKSKADELANSIQKAFKDFISGINFEPLMNSFTNLKNSLAPFVDLAMGGLSWVWENVLKPLGKWTIEKFLPTVINLLAEAFEALYNIILDLKPYAEWLWENFLKPLATWTGEVVITALENLTNKLKDFNYQQKEMKDNNVFQSDGFINASGTIAGIASALAGIWAVGKISALPGVISTLSTKLGAVVKILAGFSTTATIVIAIIALCVKAFVELWQENEEFRMIFTQVWDNVKKILKSVWENVLKPILTTIVDVLADIWENGLEPLWKAFKYAFGEIAKLVGDLFNEISPIFLWLLDIFGVEFKGVLKTLGDGFSSTINLIISVFTLLLVKIGESVSGIRDKFNIMVGHAKDAWDGIKSVFSKVGEFFSETFSKAWGKVKDIFSTGGKVFDGIKEGIASTFKNIVNGLIRGINKIVSAPFNAINRMLNKIRATTVLGISPFKSLWSYDPISIPEIPQFARGGFADGGGLFQAGEFGKAEMIGNYGGKTTVMPLENTDFVSAMYDAIYSATIDAMSQNGGSDDKEIVLRMNEYTLGKATIKGINRVTRQDGKLGIEGI